MSEPIKKPRKTPESYTPKKPDIVTMMDDAEKNIDEELQNFGSASAVAPERLILDNFPKPAYYYTLPQHLGSIMSYIEKTITPDEANRDLMNIMGIAYTFLWLPDGQDDLNVLEDLWRINKMDDNVDAAMRFYGRNYLYIEGDESFEYQEEIKKAIVASINRGIPVLAGNVSAIHDFSVITGYDKNGDFITGWAANMHHAPERLDNGMFIKAFALSSWGKHSRFLFIGGKNKASLSDKEIIDNIIRTMSHSKSQNTEYCVYPTGFAALNAFKNELAGKSEKIIKAELKLPIMNMSCARPYITGFLSDLCAKYSGNMAITALFSEIKAINDKTREICTELESTKNDDSLAAEVRCEKMADLVQDFIDQDTELLTKMKKLSESLAKR